jgi:hypothetical protein
MNAFVAVSLFLLAVVAGFMLISLALFWLVPIAFLIDFSFMQAMASAALLLLVAGLLAPASLN